MLNISKKKYYYLFNFINIFIKNKYLFFMKDNILKNLITEYKIINYVKIKATIIKKLFIKNNFFNLFKNNILIIYFNNIEIFEILSKYNNNNLLFLTSSMYLLNNNYKVNIFYYYSYYKDNYLLYKEIIFLFFPEHKQKS